MQEQGPKYWDLSEVDRQVWDTTRGIKRGRDVVDDWSQELCDAVDAEIITEDEHARVLRKWTLMKHSLPGISRDSRNT